MLDKLRTLGETSNIERIQLRAADTGQGLTGLDNSSSGLIISTICDNEASATAYTVAGSKVETITTIGTYAAPTSTKCRFKIVDATNHPGLVEVQLADARYAVSGAKMLRVTISGATNLLQREYCIGLDQPVNATKWLGTAIASPDTAGYPKITVKNGSGAGEILTSTGKVVDVALVENVGSVGTGAILAASLGAGALDGVWATASRTLTAQSDSSGTTTLLSRVSSARAGYFDYLNNPALLDISSLGRVWYVNQSTGNDANDGKRRSTAFATYGAAESAANHGDTIWLVGVYTSVVVIDKAIWLRGDNGSKSIISTSGTNDIGIFITDAAETKDVRISNIGLALSGANSVAIAGDDIQNLEVWGVRILTATTGFDLGGDARNVVLRRNYVGATVKAVHATNAHGLVIDGGTYEVDCSTDVDCAAFSLDGCIGTLKNGVKGRTIRSVASAKITAALATCRQVGTVGNENASTSGCITFESVDLSAAATSGTHTGPVYALTYSLASASSALPYTCQAKGLALASSNLGSGGAVDIHSNSGSLLSGAGVKYATKSGSGTVSITEEVKADVQTALTSLALTHGGTGMDALEAALAQGYGKWSINNGAKTLTLYAPDKTTILKVFDISPDMHTPSSRTPQ